MDSWAVRGQDTATDAAVERSKARRSDGATGRGVARCAVRAPCQQSKQLSEEKATRGVRETWKSLQRGDLRASRADPADSLP